MASLESSSSHSLTVSAIPGAEYSIDGGTTWQTGNTFSGLDADKSYTILVRMAEDENHTASGTRPVSGRTTDTPVNILDTDIEETEEITEKLKAQDQMAWVRAMNSIRNRAEEIVRHELIYDAKEVL